MMPKHYSDALMCELPLLGFGAMRLPTSKDEAIDKEHVRKMVEHAYANGVNYFDTAYMYHRGQSEVVMGDLLSAYPRESFMLATKLPVVFVKEEGDQERFFEEQLSRCKVDYFDFYLAHALDKEKLETMKKFGTVDFLLKLKAEGKIKHLGFSFHDDAQCFKEALAMAPWEFVQLQLNYYDMEASAEAPALHKLATEAGLPIFLMEPVRGGMLANMPDDAVKILKNVNSEKPPAAFALEWTLELEGVALTLSGMSNLDQVVENVETFTNFTEIPEKERQAVKECAAFLTSYKTIGCTNCQYCMPCPANLDIPGLFKTYNDYKLLHNIFRSTLAYKDVVKPDACIHCNQCISACPQQLPVPDLLEQVGEELSVLLK